MTMFFVNPLVTLVVILAVGLAIVIALPAVKVNFIRQVALATSIFALLVGLLSCLAFDKSNFGFQFLYRLSFIPQYNITFTLGADGLSMVFLLLTLFIFPILFLSA